MICYSMEDKLSVGDGQHRKEPELTDDTLDTSGEIKVVENSAKVSSSDMDDDYYTINRMRIVTPSDIIIKMLHETALERRCTSLSCVLSASYPFLVNVFVM